MADEKRNDGKRVLVVGASRGLGEAVVEDYARRGARVIGTARSDGGTPLHRFAGAAGGAVEVERVDIADRGELDALAERLQGRSFDLLFVVAGISLAPRGAIAADVDDADFALMMQTNALGAIRAVEALGPLVEPEGTIAVMSSGQGSIAGNRSGGFEVYRATKAALNQLMRSYAARHEGDRRALLLLAPGWVRTDMGGDGAPFSIADSIPPLVDTIEAQSGIAGLRYLDRHGETVPW
ncbi:SDR family NAD(P)-dependent oxidoreductase [uncultured Leifsonia sp.]|uniref:SDR family NAD(P)-dependent oxidoreductase n=1 Tax=uncultured Leifsonia sp. TaxID=340359 RepID=UPI0028D4DC24|nr:SDR family NAD(P)-dependent oxidoreductase [uncultured Leifsonia sp.]